MAVLVATVVVASVWPATGVWAQGISALATTLVVCLFFLHGVRTPPERLRAALVDWRLHGVILAVTFVAFPLAGLSLRALAPHWLPDAAWLGVLFLCALPSTVQSSVAFTSMAHGNVAATLTAAAASNIIGIALTPVIIGLISQVPGVGFSFAAVGKIVVQLLLPFAVGQLGRRWLLGWVTHRAGLLSFVDRGTIAVAVYSAFSAAAVNGTWHAITPRHVAILAGLCCALLALALAMTRYGARALGFSQEDEISIVFCGSKKSLVSGVPMARVLFPDTQFGAVVLPLMIFHQLQLMACAWLARRYAARTASARPGTAPQSG